MHGLVLFGFVVLCVLVVVLAGLLGVLLVQHGRALQRIEELEEHASGVGHRGPPPLEIGTEAPRFTLRDLDGRKRRLEDYRGEPVAVVFFNPRCEQCLRLSEHFSELPPDRRALLVTQGEVEEIRRLRDGYRWRCDVVHEDDWKVVDAYRVHQTPSAYLLDAEGRVASGLAVGVDAVVALMGGTRDAEPAPAANGHDARTLRTRDVSESRLVRDGLAAGTTAPDFTLPDLEGRSRSLADFRGRPVLLVFSAVDCPPCAELAPSLVRLQERVGDDLGVVMISHGDPQLNRLKATAFGYPFPVLLQRGREVAKAYGTFETPVGYLIDAEGVIAADLAVGGDAILSLAGAAH